MRGKFPDVIHALNHQWSARNPDKEQIRRHERNRKGGRFYDQKRKYTTTGLQGEKQRVRWRHGKRYAPYKKIIDPEGLTQLHHQWYPETANYRGVALVETDQHMHGFIDVIQILEGEITLFREVEIRNNEEMSE